MIPIITGSPITRTSLTVLDLNWEEKQKMKTNKVSLFIFMKIP